MTNYDKILKICEKGFNNVEKLKTDNKFEEINKCIVFYEDLNSWLHLCGGFEDNPLVKEAKDECLRSIILCSQGYYKDAIIVLRQFLEHILFAILLSSNDYQYRLWKAGKSDMSWVAVVDGQKGVFGKDFIRVYGKGISEERSAELITVAKNAYRECSEFVHGNYVKLISLSNGLEYDANMVDKYLEFFLNIQYLVCMGLFIRYKEIFDEIEVLKQLEPMLMDYLGELSEVQFMYSKEV